MIKNVELKRRIIEISYRHNLSHIGSCLTALPIIDEIYKTKKSDEKFVLSSGHAGLALYVVLEKYTGMDAEAIFKHHGVHPDVCSRCGIDCSAGSLGHGLGISVGIALADRTKNVYCLISDGEMAEGSISEALRVWIEQKLTNLHIFLNVNGWAAYRKTNPTDFDNFARYGINVRQTNMNDYPTWLQGQAAHYVVMNEEQHNEIAKLLSE